MTKKIVIGLTFGCMVALVISRYMYHALSHRQQGGNVSVITDATLPSEEERAIQYYTNMIGQEPNNPYFYLERGKTKYSISNYESGKIQDAISDMNKAIAIDSNYKEAYYQRSLFSLGYEGALGNEKLDITKAMRDLDKVIKIDPKDIRAYMQKAHLEENPNNWTKPLAIYSQVIAIDPHNAEAYAKRADCYRGEKEYDKAIQDFSQAIAIEPLYVDAYEKRANLYAFTKQPAQAIQDFTHLIELTKDRNGIMFVFGERTTYQQGMSADQYYYWRGIEYYNQGKYEKAVEDYKSSIKIGSQVNGITAGHYFRLGQVYDALGKYDQALMNYNKAIDMYPDSPDFRYYRGILYKKLGKDKQSESDLQKYEWVKKNIPQA